MSGQLGISIVAPRGVPVRRYCLFLHGILGSRSNWRALARKIVDGSDGWGAVLVDLRKHGDSQRGFLPPHTVASAARDLLSLAGETPIEAVLGHSFGGKVALAYTERASAVSRVIVVDSTPSARPDRRGSDSIGPVLEALEHVPHHVSKREDFIEALEARGLSRGIAEWLAMNLDRDDEGFSLSIDFEAIRALIDDYFAVDLWPVIDPPRPGLSATLIAGGRSQSFDAADLSRARSIPGVELHVVPDAGHWVHVDAPEAVIELAIAALSARAE